MTNAEVDSELRAMGSDPDEVGDMGRVAAYLGQVARFRWPGEMQHKQLQALLAEVRAHERAKPRMQDASPGIDFAAIRASSREVLIERNIELSLELVKLRARRSSEARVEAPAVIQALREWSQDAVSFNASQAAQLETAADLIAVANCTSPNGRRDGHGGYIEQNERRDMICSFCKVVITKAEDRPRSRKQRSDKAGTPPTGTGPKR